MSNEYATHEAPTRREYVKYGGAVVGGGLLAGCTGDEGSDSTPKSPTESETESSDAATEAEDTSYSVRMAPMGTVEFDAVPERVAIYDAVWADHLVALGQQDRIISLGFPDGYYTGYYEQLPGVEFDTSDLTAMWSDGLPKELFYELDPNMFHLDPCRWLSFDSGWDRGDFEEIKQNVAPFFANRFSRAHSEPPEGECRDNYEYYTIWELSEKFGQVYQVPDRSAELQAVRDEMVTEIQSELPPEGSRPTVALLIFVPDENSFWAYQVQNPGFETAHLRPLGVKDTFIENVYGEAEQTAFDIEQLLEVDPEIIIHNWDIEPSDRTDAMYDYFESDPVAAELTAVQNDRVYIGGTPLQGPIFNLFQIEMAAKQVYPERFGEWNGVGENPEEERLFDRQRVADIINGDI